jgi:hypothetical protein
MTSVAAAVPWLPTRELIATKYLELRKRRGLMIAIAVLTLAPPVLILGIRLIAHLADPSRYGPAGSPSLFSPITGLIAEFGFIVAAALGASAGSTDLTDGFFRQLVVTGRSRLALYLARVPAGLAIIVPPVALGFAVLCVVISYASGPPVTTSLAVAEMVKVGLWLTLEVGIGFLVGLGLGSLLGQRTIPTVLLIVLEIIITPELASHAIPYFLDGQRLVVGLAMEQLRPAVLTAGQVGGPLGAANSALRIPPMPTWAVITVIASWVVGWSVIGAWRMITRDA